MFHMLWFVCLFLLPHFSLVFGKDNGCPIFRENDKVRVTFTACQVEDGFYYSGCNITLKCESGHRPKVILQSLSINGEQNLRCLNGTWIGQQGFSENPLVCEEGCVARALAKEQKNDIQNFMYYDADTDSAFLSQCTFTFYVHDIRQELAEYYCPITAKDLPEGGCFNVCFVPSSFPEGTVVKKQFPPLSDEMFMYTYGGLEMVLECAEGYQYDSTSTYSSYGRQVIQCDGESGKLIDKLTGTEAVLQSCEVKPGCNSLPLSDNSKLISENSLCAGNKLSAGCNRTYTCKEGYYPADITYLYQGGQIVTCENGKWLNKDKAVVNETLVCKFGCATIDYTRVATVVTGKNNKIDYDMIQDTAGEYHACYTNETLTHIKRVISELPRQASDYFCEKDVHETDIQQTIEFICPDSCPILNTQKLPDGVKLESAPATFEAFGRHLVPKNSAYLFKCDAGYKYTSVEYKNMNRQRILCAENQQYVDSNSNTVTQEIASCSKIICSINSITSETVITFNQSCLDGPQLEGCQLVMKCADGHYPQLEKYQMFSSIQAICQVTNNESKWVDKLTGMELDEFHCTAGCLPRPRKSQIFKVNGVEIVCAVGISGTETGHYYCNNTVGEYNRIPCSNVCLPLRFGESLKKKNLFEHLILNRFVAFGDGFEISCPSGMVFRETETNSRLILCGSDGQYKDMRMNESINYIADTCILPASKPTCFGNIPSNDRYTSIQASCSKDANGRLNVGCQVEIDCLEGSSFSADSSEKSRLYTCEKGLYRNLRTNLTVAIIDDRCKLFEKKPTTPRYTVVSVCYMCK